MYIFARRYFFGAGYAYYFENSTKTIRISELKLVIQRREIHIILNELHKQYVFV